MVNKDKHTLGDLIRKSEDSQISETEKELLDSFIKHEYDSASWESVQMGTRHEVSTSIYRNLNTGKFKKPRPYYYKYAAAAMLALLLSIAVVLRPELSPKEEITFNTTSNADSVKLADGTMVYLAANSSFKYPKQFTDHTRPVSLLKGNAFFKVKKDPDHPFIITSEEIRTKVLGTSFHISMHNHECRVTVVTGKVNVSSDKHSIDLVPEEEAIYTADGLKKQKANSAFLYNWYQKDVELTNVSMAKVFTLLNYKYGMSFKPEKEQILGTKITIYIKGELSLKNILDQISYITHLKFRTYDKTVTVSQ